GVSADAQSERYDGDAGEDRGLLETPDRVAEVLRQGYHYWQYGRYWETLRGGGSFGVAGIGWGSERRFCSVVVESSGAATKLGRCFCGADALREPCRAVEADRIAAASRPGGLPY